MRTTNSLPKTTTSIPLVRVPSGGSSMSEQILVGTSVGITVAPLELRA